MTKSPACATRSGPVTARPTPHDDQVGLLQAQLQRHLDWHRARLNFLAKALLALLAASSVNLTKVARAFSGPAQLDSHYKRLQGGFFYAKSRELYGNYRSQTRQLCAPT